MAYRGVLLDFYGTVVEEDDAVIRSIVQRILRAHPEQSEAVVADRWWQEVSAHFSAAHGADFRPQRELVTDSLDTVLREMGSALDATELTATQFDYWRAPALREGSREFLAACPVPVCIVSNIDRADLNAAIRHAGLSIPLSVTSEEVRSYKPQPELFEEGLRLLGLGRDEVLHVGDSRSSDVAGANALGIDVAWVNPSRHSSPVDARIRQQCTDLRELLPLLRG